MMPVAIIPVIDKVDKTTFFAHNLANWTTQMVPLTEN